MKEYKQWLSSVRSFVQLLNFLLYFKIITTAAVVCNAAVAKAHNSS